MQYLLLLKFLHEADIVFIKSIKHIYTTPTLLEEYSKSKAHKCLLIYILNKAKTLQESRKISIFFIDTPSPN